MKLRHIFNCLMVPNGLVLLLSVVVWNLAPRPDLLGDFLLLWPYIVVATTVLLGCRYGRSRLLLMLLVVTLTQPSLWQLMSPPRATLTLSALTILLPVNLLWIAFASERHLLSFSTLRRFMALVAQGGMVWVSASFYPHHLQKLVSIDLFQWPLFKSHFVPFFQPLPPLAFATFMLTFLCFMTVLCWRPTLERGALVWMVFSVFMAQRTTGDEAVFYSATAIVILLASLLENSHSMAFRDELTGLGSRRALNDYLNRLCGSYTLAMVDIDHFKRVNDTYGHDIGDQVLKMVASCLARVKGGGKAFRYGGEEFILVFSARARDDVLPHLETLRETISHADFALRSQSRPKKRPKKQVRQNKKTKSLNVTVSMGLAEHGSRKQSADQVIKQADNALYRAKKSGRNRIC